MAALSAGAITLYNTTGSYAESISYSNPSSDGKTWLVTFTGAWRQEVCGLGYVNSLVEQDTATAVDSGGVLPTSHFLQYSLGPTFGTIPGTLVGNPGSYDSVAIQPADSDVVVAGVTGSDLTVTRYNANGSLDTSFGTSGIVTLSETSPTFAKLAIDASGNIDVAVNSGSNVEVYQLSDAGSTNWSTALTFATGVVPQGIALEPSGDIVVAGDSSSGTGIYLAGLNPSTGAVDTGFGSSGYVNAPLSGNPSGLSAALDSTGNILVAGSDGGDFSVVRFTSSGSIDATFGTSGEAKVNMGGTDTAYAVSAGPGGTIVAAGVSVQSGNNDASLIRLTSAGALDTSFNSTGKTVGSSGSGTIRAILVQTNGEILAGGDAGSGTAQKVWMFTPAGAADTEFASGGTLTANSGATVYGWAVASGPTQRIVVAGSYGGDEALAAFAPDSVRLYAEQSANYNVMSMVDPYGNVDQRYVYDPYGNMTVLSAAWTPQSDLFDTQVGFQGMWLDQASGLYHTLNRDYSVTLGRWMEEDPKGYVNGASQYQFELSNPDTGQDPSGTNVKAKFFTMEWTPGFEFADLDANMASGGTPYADAEKTVETHLADFYHNQFIVPSVTDAGLYSTRSGAGNGRNGPPGTFLMAAQVITLTWFICDPNDDVSLEKDEDQSITSAGRAVAAHQPPEFPQKGDTWYVSGLKGPWADDGYNKLLVYVDAPSVIALPKTFNGTAPFTQTDAVDQTVTLLDHQNPVTSYRFRARLWWDSLTPEAEVVHGA